jgi:hypothetical protein
MDYFAANIPFIFGTRYMWTYHYEITLILEMMTLYQSLEKLGPEWSNATVLFIAAFAFTSSLI